MILVVKLQRTRAPMMLNNLVPWKAGSAFFENRYYGNSWIGSLFSPIRLKKQLYTWPFSCWNFQANDKQQGVSITWNNRGLQKAPVPEQMVQAGSRSLQMSRTIASHKYAKNHPSLTRIDPEKIYFCSLAIAEAYFRTHGTSLKLYSILFNGHWEIVALFG